MLLKIDYDVIIIALSQSWYRTLEFGYKMTPISAVSQCISRRGQQLEGQSTTQEPVDGSQPSRGEKKKIVITDEA